LKCAENAAAQYDYQKAIEILNNTENNDKLIKTPMPCLKNRINCSK